MISALRKIEGRGELPGQPRRSWKCASTIRARGFPIFSIPTRQWMRASRASCASPAVTIRARSPCQATNPQTKPPRPTPSRKRRRTGNGKPFLPDQPPVNLGSADGEPGPWGPHRR